MNDTRSMLPRHPDTEALQARCAWRVAACLSSVAESTSPDVNERLRFARESALARSRALRAAAAAPALQGSGGASTALALGGGPKLGQPWWSGFAWLVPLLALVLGLVLIQHQNLRAQIKAAAEVDFDLLVDDLPPAAYSDQGFLEFLKTPRD